MSGDNEDLLYKRKVHMLAQTFFIKDNQQELLLHAHKYDFDVLFFDQMIDFRQGMAIAEPQDLFVVDLDCLYSLQKDRNNRSMYLFEMLRQLPDNRSYVYLETARQSDRFLLQQMLVEYNCTAYAAKPISNENLVEKLFNLFARNKKADLSTVVSLMSSALFDHRQLLEHNVQLLEHGDAETLHNVVKKAKPDIVLLDDISYRRLPAVVDVIKRNIEIDPSLEILLYLNSVDAQLVSEAIRRGVDGVIVDNDAQVATEQLLSRIDKIRINKNLINKDRATGLLNKIGFQRKAYDVIRAAELKRCELGFCIIDIDKFKTINDTWGHFFGDIVIKRLSLLLESYIGENDLLSRFGGEEFVMLFWDIERQSTMDRLNRMREAFHALRFEVEPGQTKHFSFSGGVAFFPDFHSENELFLHSDAMLYRAKTSGRNQIRC